MALRRDQELYDNQMFPIRERLAMSQNMKTCPNCGTLVWPIADGTCPACKTHPFPPEPSKTEEKAAMNLPEGILPSPQKIPSPDLSEGLTEAVDPRLKGIGGWLLLPATGLPIGLLINGLIMIIRAFTMEFPPHGLNPGLSLYLMIRYLVGVVLLIWLALIVIRFFQKRRELPRTIIAYLRAQVIALLVLFAIRLIMAPIGVVIWVTWWGQFVSVVLVVLFWVVWFFDDTSFIKAALAAAIWIPYFKKSKRVKATFVN
ncbi:MAG: DUF2569 family protein [Thermoguttaceae bacterium]|nr:DUF2569 family protein [Thermoguttaceae bacterium]